MASVWLTLLLAVLFAQRAHLQDDATVTVTVLLVKHDKL